MGPEQMVILGGAVGTIARIVTAVTRLTGPWAVFACLVISTIVLAIWGYDAGTFVRDQTWEYFVAWIEINAIAAGAFHLTEEGQKLMKKED